MVWVWELGTGEHLTCHSWWLLTGTVTIFLLSLILPPYSPNLKQPEYPSCHFPSNEIRVKCFCSLFSPHVTKNMRPTPNQLVQTTSRVLRPGVEGAALSSEQPEGRHGYQIKEQLDGR